MSGSWYDSDEILDLSLRDLLQDQAEVWSSIDEEKFVAVMDKKPELHYGKDFVENKLPTPPFIVEPFFPSGGLCLLHGKRGLGKSMLATTLTKAICTGEPFLGQFPVRKGVVVYIQLDMTDTVFQDRLREAGDFYKFDDWYVLTGVADFMRANENTKWVQQVVAAMPDLIIIDTLRKAHTLSENESDSAGRFYSKLRELFGYTAVMMIHHDRKTTEFNQASGMVGESFRGSGAWLDDVDAGLHFKQIQGKLVLEFSKTRTCPDIEPIPIGIDDATLSIMSDTESRTPKTVTARQQGLAFRRSNPQATQEDVYQFLMSSGSYSKSQASKAAKEIIHTPLPTNTNLTLPPSF
jgi:energy-coupling factor transporter ATP-binding protein EcfA2